MPCRRRILYFCLLCSYLYTNAQQMLFSRDFAAVRSHVPIQIIDQNPESFCVLRYNKKIHDFTVERRNRLTFEITQFASLSLDSVNANWFDYENLNYLFFEYNHRLYFVFEKILNKKKTLYYKCIDSSGKASGFITLATIENEDNAGDMAFVFQRSGPNKLLIIGENYYANTTAKKVVMLYNFDKNKQDYIIKLPLENQSTGFSSNYVSHNERLYYTMSNNYLGGYRKKYTVNKEMMLPYQYTKFLSLNLFNLNSKEMAKTQICLSDPVEIKSANLMLIEQQIMLDICYVKNDNNQKSICFLRQGANLELSEQKYCRIKSLDSMLAKQLYFYDGSDQAEVTEKFYRAYKHLETKKYSCFLNERCDENSFDEILLWRANNKDGNIEMQKIMPRKMFYFGERSRYKHLQEVGCLVKDDCLYALMLEHKYNIKASPENYQYKEIKRQKHLASANLMLYELNKDGLFNKRLIYKNGIYNAVPIKFDGNNSAYIIYLNKKGRERFAILPLQNQP